MPSLHIMPSFQRYMKKLSSSEKEKTIQSTEEFFDFLHGKQVAKGFGFKKLAPDIFEFRVDIHLRIAGIVEKDSYYLHLVGSHDQVRRFSKERL